MCMYMYENIHGGARQASDPWTVAVPSLLALISRECVLLTLGAHAQRGLL